MKFFFLAWNFKGSNFDRDVYKSIGTRIANNPQNLQEKAGVQVFQNRTEKRNNSFSPKNKDDIDSILQRKINEERGNKGAYNIFEKNYEQKYFRNSSGYGNRTEKGKNVKENSLNSIKREELKDLMGIDFFTPPANTNKQASQNYDYLLNKQPPFDQERSKIRGYAAGFGNKEDGEGSSRARNMSEDFFPKGEGGGGLQKNFARNIKQTLNFNSDNPHRVMEREMQRMRWQEELANQLESKRNMKLEELKKRKWEAEMEEQRIIREREEINKNYLKQIEREERQIKTKGIGAGGNNSKPKDNSGYKPISEAEEIFLKKKAVPMRRTPPLEVKRHDPIIEKRDQHSKSVIENLRETDRGVEARRNSKDYAGSRKAEFKEEMLLQQVGAAQNLAKAGPKNDEGGAQRNPLFDIHDKLLKQLEDMKKDIKQIDFQRDQAQSDLKNLRNLLKKRAEEAESLKPEPLVIGSKLFASLKEDLELPTDPSRLESGEALERLLRSKLGNVEFNGESKFIGLSDDWKKALEEDLERQKFKDLVLEEARTNKEDIASINIDARIIEYKERLAQQEIAAAREKERLLLEEESRRKQQLIEEENKKRQLELEEDERKKKRQEEEIRRRQEMEEEDKARREDLNPKLIEAEKEHELLKERGNAEEPVKEIGINEMPPNNEDHIVSGAEQQGVPTNIKESDQDNVEEAKEDQEVADKKKRELSQPLFDENGEVKLRYAFTPPNKKKSEKNAQHVPDGKKLGDPEINPEAVTKTQFGRLDRLVEDFKK